MMNGTRFLEVLAHLSYPEASSLNSSDFDNMFDSTPENKDFVHFLCSLSSLNVMSNEEYKAYHALEVSGKPILTEQVLDEMEILRGPAGPVEEDENDSGEGEVEGKSVEQLQRELEELRRQQSSRQRRLHQLQCLRRKRDDHALTIRTTAQSQSQSEGDEGNNIVKAVARENMATNATLQELKEEVERLQKLTLMNKEEAEVQLQEQQIIDRHARVSAALLSQLPIEPYVQKAQVTHQCIMDTYKTKLTLLGEKVEEGDETREVHTKRELARLQATHMLLQGQLLQARAEEAGAVAAKAWLRQLRHPSTKLTALQSDVSPGVNKERVCLALWRRTQHLCSDVLKGHTQEQGALTAQHACLQERLLWELQRQKAQLELLQAVLQLEQQGHTRGAAHTESLALELREEAAQSAERTRGLEKLQEEAPQSDPILSTTDPTVKRLLQVCKALEKPDGWLAGPADIAAMASEWQAELRRLTDSESEAVAEQLQLVSALEKDRRPLEECLESQSDTPALTSLPSTSPLCTSAQELTQLLRELEQQSSALYRQLQELTAERSSKRTQLERSAPLRRERELYTLFHLDPAALVQAVEDQENRKEGL